jgi:hypothetical protein
MTTFTAVDGDGTTGPVYPVSCTTRMPCRRVMRAIGQRATTARLPSGHLPFLSHLRHNL